MLETKKIAPVSPEIVGDHQEPISSTKITTGQYRSTDFLLGFNIGRWPPAPKTLSKYSM